MSGRSRTGTAVWSERGTAGAHGRRRPWRVLGAASEGAAAAARPALRASTVLLAFAAFVGCGVAADEAVGTAPGPLPPRVVLVSLDGTRPADVTPAALPSLVALAERGAIAEGLMPVDPSNTFPSHVSMATGVRPDVHRLVNNRFVDPERGTFDRDEPHSWIESEPIWSIAERHGVPTASFYWVGSEGPWSGGPGPGETRRFSSRTSEKKKVDQILEWLAIDEPARRPRLILSWFHGADHAAHLSGPDSAAAARALRRQDPEIARLVDEMERRGLFASTTLIFVSDHGMVRAERRVNLGRLLARAGLRAKVLGIGGFVSVVFEGGAPSAAVLDRARQLARAEGLEAWRPAAAPADWHVDDPRFGHLVVRAPIGTAIVSRSTLIEGFHGYDGREPGMAGLLVARGRGVVPGTRLGQVSGLAIAPTVLRLLDLPVPPQMREPPIDGLLAGLAGRDASGHAAGGAREAGAVEPRPPGAGQPVDDREEGR